MRTPCFKKEARAWLFFEVLLSSPVVSREEGRKGGRAIDPRDAYARQRGWDAVGCVSLFTRTKYTDLFGGTAKLTATTPTIRWGKFEILRPNLAM